MRGWAIVVSLALLGGTPPAGAQSLLVSAAASLTQAFREVGQAFEAAHPGTKVAFNFAASDVLLTQIAHGAPADVFASADEVAMNRAEKDHLTLPGTRRDFAANRLVVIAPRLALPATSLSSLLEPRFKRIAVGSPQTVPAGRYAREALDREGLWVLLLPKLVFTQNVRQALDYVAREEADAALVYATDAAILPDRVKVAFEVATPTPLRYPIAVVRDTGQRARATDFVAFVAGAGGQSILARHGFRAP